MGSIVSYYYVLDILILAVKSLVKTTRQWAVTVNGSESLISIIIFNRTCFLFLFICLAGAFPPAPSMGKTNEQAASA